MFNVRVYGLLIHNNRILLVQEPVKNNLIVKFPGGGLEFGEGTLDGLKREFKEELQTTITKLDHFYTTDFFVQSFINPNDQVISIYYLVDVAINELNFNNEEGLKFTWLPLHELHSDLFQLPIDKHVVAMLQQRLTT
jgi:8-oxo-dGTP diphosphatase